MIDIVPADLVDHVQLLSAVVLVAGIFALLSTRGPAELRTGPCRSPVESRTAYAVRRYWSARVGQVVRAYLRVPAASKSFDRAIGRGLLVLVLLVLIDPVALLALPMAAVGGWWWGRRRLAAARLQMIDGLADVVDLMRVATGAGLGLSPALDAVVRHGSGPFCHQLEVALVRQSQGEPLDDALAQIVESLGADVALVVDPLVAAARYGDPLSLPLELVSRSLRADRQRRRYEAAQRLPVQLLFPLVCCVLPAFVLLTMAPLVVTAFSDLTG